MREGGERMWKDEREGRTEADTEGQGERMLEQGKVREKERSVSGRGSGSGSGNGNGNGNGNGGTNHDGIGGGHRSDEDKETYNERKLEYLESQETKYELSLRKANAKLSFFRNKKTRLAKKGQKDETIDHEMSLYKDIQNGSRFRLIVARN